MRRPQVRGVHETPEQRRVRVAEWRAENRVKVRKYQAAQRARYRLDAGRVAAERVKKRERKKRAKSRLAVVPPSLSSFIKTFVGFHDASHHTGSRPHSCSVLTTPLHRGIVSRITEDSNPPGSTC